jgi:hypothetical protein
MYEATTYAAGGMQLVSNSDTLQKGGAALDQGACCETALLFSTWVGTLSVPAATYTAPTSAESIAGITMVAQACPAVTGGTWGNGGGTDYIWDVSAAALDVTQTVWTSWWCSNGLYKKVTAVSTSIQNTT